MTVNVSNLPAALAGKEVFVTQFLVDETHSNPYSVWTSQSKPTEPDRGAVAGDAQGAAPGAGPAGQQDDRRHLVHDAFTINRQGATLLILGLKRPVTGRNALVEIEGEDYDGQSGATKEDSNDTQPGPVDLRHRHGYVYFENVDFSDGGVGSVQLRVKSQAATTLELHADSQTGALLGRCMVPSTSNAWATQTCTLDQTATGVARLYLVFGGAMHLNWLKFVPGTVSPAGTGGAGGGAGGAGGSAAGGMVAAERWPGRYRMKVEADSATAAPPVARLAARALAERRRGRQRERRRAARAGGRRPSPAVATCAALPWPSQREAVARRNAACAGSCVGGAARQRSRGAVGGRSTDARPVIETAVAHGR